MSTTTSTDPSSIAEYAQGCLRDFQIALDSFTSTNAETVAASPTVSRALHDEFGRFRLWCGNIGAHRQGRSSLDHKLREASHIRDQVLGLLRRILSSLSEIDAINNGRKVPWDAETTSETDGSDDESEADEGCSTTELQQLATSIADIITDLMQLSSTIRNPAPHDLFKRSGNIDTSYYEEFDIQHVKGKFPEAEQYLITRMGRAISRRRQYLRYREEHRARLAEALDITDTSAKEVASTVASSIPAQLKSGFQAVELEDDDEFVDHASQTSYASSMPGATALRPPPLPQEGREGKPFECSLCHYFTVVDVETDWQKHVYRDLQPYVCTFEDCTSADRTYESRREWFSHELQEHRQVWNCIEGCQQSFRSQNQFQAHLKHSHTQSIADRGIDVVAKSHSTYAAASISTDCPLCRRPVSSLRQLRSHLGKHQRELSLFAIPSSVHEEQEEDRSPSNETSDSGSESDAIKEPVFECSFWFLSCCYLSKDRYEWSRHCYSHFHGEEPPLSVKCSLCGQRFLSEIGEVAWATYLKHLERHFTSGDTLQNSQPDPHLCSHLWQKRLIDDHDLKLLKAGTDSLSYDHPSLFSTKGKKLGHANSEAPSGGYMIPLSEVTQADSPGAISDSEYERSHGPHSNPDSEPVLDVSDSLPRLSLEGTQNLASAGSSRFNPTQESGVTLDVHQEEFPTHLFRALDSTEIQHIDTRRIRMKHERREHEQPREELGSSFRSQDAQVLADKSEGDSSAETETLKDIASGDYFSTHISEETEKLYKCPRCSERFQQVLDVTAHMEFHIGKPPYTCSECGRDFASEDSLAEHGKDQGCANRLSSLAAVAESSETDEILDVEEVREGQKTTPDQAQEPETIVGESVVPKPQELSTEDTGEEANLHHNMTTNALDEPYDASRSNIGCCTIYAVESTYRWTCCYCLADNSYDYNVSCYNCSHWRQ